MSLAEADVQFDTLAAEWQTVCATVADKARAMHARVHTEWAAAIAEMAAEHAALRAAGRWVGGPGDLFAVVGVHRTELVHSAAVAWLLDPRMRHGFGIEFLRRFLARCFPGEEFAAMDTARCEREVPRERTRIDILVQADDWLVLIENKVDAPEQPGQCDYNYDLYGDEPGSLFVFLTPRGWRPQTATDLAADAFVALSYRSLRDDLRETLAATVSSPTTAASGSDWSGSGVARLWRSTRCPMPVSRSTSRNCASGSSTDRRLEGRRGDTPPIRGGPGTGMFRLPLASTGQTCQVTAQ